MQSYHGSCSPRDIYQIQNPYSQFTQLIQTFIYTRQLGAKSHSKNVPAIINNTMAYNMTAYIHFQSPYLR